MKKLLLVSLTILSHQFFSQSFQWVKEFGGSNAEINSLSVTTDASGNIYTTGVFRNTVDFDPGPSTYTIASISGSSVVDGDIFISKLDANGNFVWAKNMGGSYSIYGNSIKIDLSGNIYVTGEFRGTVDFDPNIGVQQITSIGVNDIFVLKLDANGNLMWVKTFGDTSIDYGKSIALDGMGNVYVTGSFKGSIDFDPGVGTSYVNALGNDLFILKLDGSGNFGWVKTMGATISSCGPESINLDAQGNIYTTGGFYGPIDFDPNATSTYTLNANGGGIFVSKLNALGGFVWAKNMGSPTQSGLGQSITTDQSGNVYTTGQFQGVSDFDPSAGTYALTALGSSDIFISKLDINGNFTWAKSIGGGSNGCSGNSIALDPFGDIYITGFYTGINDFDPGISSVTLVCASQVGFNSYILKLAGNGNYVDVKKLNSIGNCVGNSLTVDPTGNIFLTGVFYGLTDFNEGTGIDTLTSSGTNSHSYVLKLGSSLTAIENISSSNNSPTAIYPNPNNGSFNVITKEKMKLNLIDNLGRIIQAIELNEANDFKGDIHILSSGIYFISGQSDQGFFNQKIIVTQ